jgi:hypothetical protein
MWLKWLAPALTTLVSSQRFHSTPIAVITNFIF